MGKVKLYNAYVNIEGACKWYKIKTFKSLEKTNEFLNKHRDFGCLKEYKNWNDETVFIVARLDDLGAEVLEITFESEDTGFCCKYYKADCGRLFAFLDGEGLFTCNNDAWREPCSRVDERIFKKVG